MALSLLSEQGQVQSVNPKISKMNKIKSISEAFSMQPNTLNVYSSEYIQNAKERGNNLAYRIEEELIHVDSEKACTFYVGYNILGQRLFQYLASSVNVHFEVD